METYLNEVVCRLRSNAPSEVSMADSEAKHCIRWDDADPHVAIDELISVFRR